MMRTKHPATKWCVRERYPQNANLSAHMPTMPYIMKTGRVSSNSNKYRQMHTVRKTPTAETLVANKRSNFTALIRVPTAILLGLNTSYEYEG